MFNYGPKKDMTKRPDNEPKFSMKNKTDRTIITVVVITVSVLLLILAGVLLLYYKDQIFTK
jgi:signal transduction histidine kinase